MDHFSGRSSAVLLRYFGVSALAHVGWEFSHMPLYTVWRTGTTNQIIYNGLHCSIGDVMIAAFTLLLGVIVVGRRHWPERHWNMVSAVTIAAGVTYTAFSEWLNTSVRASWAYTEDMPLVPGTQLGLSPMAQWILVPSLALAVAYWSTPIARPTRHQEDVNENAW